MLITIEGLDRAARTAQAKRAAKHLQTKKRRVRVIAFPNYDTPVGRAIKAMEKNNEPYEPTTRELLYAANRVETWASEDLDARLKAGDTIVCAGYVGTGIAYSEASGAGMQKVIKAHEGLPVPDLTVVLVLSGRTVIERAAQRRELTMLDEAELERAGASYLRQAHEHGWTMVSGDSTDKLVAAGVIEALTHDLPVLIEARKSGNNPSGTAKRGHQRQLATRSRGDGPGSETKRRARAGPVSRTDES